MGRPCAVPTWESEPLDQNFLARLPPPPPRPPPSPHLSAAPAAFVVTAIPHVSQEEADERAKVIWDAVRRWRDMVPRPSLAELGRMKLEAVKQLPPLRGTTFYLPTPAPRSLDPPSPPPRVQRAKRTYDDAFSASEDEDGGADN
ncbi:hypothetical protein G7054_g12442 [Neopestalotiopsis clavispora]|nr:hypothetical protein G7054_g12442 [Neopestalotiopsis clavispora]